MKAAGQQDEHPTYEQNMPEDHRGAESMTMVIGIPDDADDSEMAQIAEAILDAANQAKGHGAVFNLIVTNADEDSHPEPDAVTRGDVA